MDKNNPRNAGIIRMLRSGKTLGVVAAKYGLTRQRIQQIAKMSGLLRMRGYK